VKVVGKKHDLLFAQLRALAVNLPEPCGYCHAKTGELCVNRKTGDVLANVPAHYARLKIAGFPNAEDPT
jgi:hypothetical protein